MSFVFAKSCYCCSNYSLTSTYTLPWEGVYIPPWEEAYIPTKGALDEKINRLLYFREIRNGKAMGQVKITSPIVFGFAQNLHFFCIIAFKHFTII